ncbi:puratrophin-1-like [Styela clava]
MEYANKSDTSSVDASYLVEQSSYANKVGYETDLLTENGLLVENKPSDPMQNENFEPTLEIVEPSDILQNEIKKSSKKSKKTAKKTKRIEDLDRSLSISLEELLQGVNNQESPPVNLTKNDQKSDFNTSNFDSPNFAENEQISNDLETVFSEDYIKDDKENQIFSLTVKTLDDSESPTIGEAINKQILPSAKQPTNFNNDESETPQDSGRVIPFERKLDFPEITTQYRNHNNDNDLSPTSQEVNSILHSVLENEIFFPSHSPSVYTESLSPAYSKEDLSCNVNEQFNTEQSDFKLSDSKSNSCQTPEYCKELSSLTLDLPVNKELDNEEEDKDGFVKLSRPRCAKEVRQDVLYSGAVTYPGCYDKNCRPVIFLHCDIINEFQHGKLDIARLMLYFVSSASYVTLVISIRHEENMETTMDSVSLFQGNRPGIISKVIFLAEDKSLHSEFDAIKAEHNVIHSYGELLDFIDVENLPLAFGGLKEYDHKLWVQQRLDIESYVLLCERLEHNFASNTVSMTTATLPTTLNDTSDMLNRHRSTMTSLLDDPRVRDLHDSGHRFITDLNGSVKQENQSYSDRIHSSYESVCSAIQRFVQAADERLLALERHLLVKQFEESCDRILSWASDRRDELHQKFGEVADSLNDLRKQRVEFDRFYLEVVKQYAQCDCLLSEANQLSSSGFLGKVNSQARNAAEKISQVVQDMEMKKEEVETASQLYLFVDQAYSWALSGMKFVASLSMSDVMTTDELQEQINKYDEYMTSHPPIPNEEFMKMQDVATRYNNLKCQRQCEIAQQKCTETKDLFVKRRKLLVKARDHQVQEIRKQGRGAESPHSKPDSSDMSEILSDSSNSNETNSVTTSEKPTRVVLRQNSDISHRLIRPPGGSNNNNNGGVPTIAEPNESAAVPSSKHRPKKMLRKSQSMSSHHSKLKIGSPLRPREPDTQGRTKWSLAIEELISTEEEYVRSLNYIIEHYYPLMNQLDDVPQALRGKRGVVFGNVENICDFHTGQFLESLQDCQDQPGRVAEVFIQHRESFSMYALYSKNKPRSDELMREHGTRFFRAKQHSLRDKMDLASYLLKPVQRMGKYALLLHNIAKHSDAPYRSLLREAESLVKFQLRHGNDLLAMDSIVGCDVNLKEQGELKRQDEFLIFHGRRKYVRHIFLFEDLVLLSKPQRVHGGHDVYHYKSSHKTSEIGLTENIGDSGLKFEIWFRRPMQDNIIFNSSTEQKKQAWVEDIRSILWQQALRNKANRRNEMVNMGVGSKPHLDIRSSQSPITDRSVASDKLMGGRVLVSRSRASIAVSTFEHACKRPHSTVSTSSTSSNGSFNLASQQPASMFDFRAIVEGEEYESGSSLCMSNSEGEPLEGAEAPGDGLPQQYVTTV